jgi:glycine betaine/proline transport system ATP-binding protein
MHDGLIEQLGTAEDLITDPATDYVAAFTRDIPRSKLLRVHTLMGPVSDDAEGEVAGDAKVAAVARQILNAPSPVRVVEDGEVVGSISGLQVAEALFADD